MVSSRHTKTLALIFAKPERSNIKWRDVENMLEAFGVSLSEGNGSRIRLRFGDHRMVLHKPHPRPDMDKGAVATLRAFLRNAGITP